MSKQNNERIGLSLNGGILVAAAGNAAIMRGFQQNKIKVDGKERPALEAFHYMSGLSGGIIPTVLYSYSQDVDSSELLDADNRIDDPSKITPEVLERRAENSIFEKLVSSLSLRAIPMIIYGLFSMNLDAIWTLTLWYGLLRPYGIQRNKHILTSSDEAKDDSIRPREGIKAIPLVNFSLAGDAEDNGRSGIQAFLKISWKLTNYFGFGKGFENYPKDDEWPEYTHTFVSPEIIRDTVEEYGGSFLMPFVASPTEVTNSCLKSSPGPDGKTFEVNSVPLKEWGGSEKPCSLEFLTGMGTNFLSMGYGINIFELEETENTAFFMRAAQTRKARLTPGGEEKDRLFFDGGNVDGLGVPALVQRKVGTIISTIWPHGGIRSYAEHYKAAPPNVPLKEWLEKCQGIALAEIASYFGYFSKNAPNLILNRMFEDGTYHLGKLREKLDLLYEAGLPLVVTMKGLKTVDNPYWGITAGETLDLTIIYVTLPTKFSKDIPVESVPPGKNEDGTSKEMLDEDGNFTNDEFKHFPNLEGINNFTSKTKFWSYLRYAALSRRQANMTGMYSRSLFISFYEFLSLTHVLNRCFPYVSYQHTLVRGSSTKHGTASPLMERRCSGDSRKFSKRSRFQDCQS